MALSFIDGRSIYIVMDEENIERVQKNDPFDLDFKKFPFPVALALPPRIVICYASKEELPVIAKLKEEGKGDPTNVIKYLERGFKVESSDHDRRYDTLK